MSPIESPTSAAFASLARSRRTSMFVDVERTVPNAVVADLCALAQWAPNHKRTWPWRFASVTGSARLRLGEAFVADMIANNFGDEGKRTKTLTKYARTPNVLVVGCVSPSPSMAADDRDAVAAGIQTLLLGATTEGLASFWSTAAITTPTNVNILCGFPEGTRIIGVVYLGYAAASVHVPAPQRPEPQITWLQ